MAKTFILSCGKSRGKGPSVALTSRKENAYNIWPKPTLETGQNHAK